MNVHVRPEIGREAELLRSRRLCKIAASPLSYVRGSTARFYEWLADFPPGTLPEGPPIWICGDCHLGNIGALADSEGRVRMQIRDLDQTVIANPAYDLVRLTLSLVTAGLTAPLSGIAVARMIEAIALGYVAGLATPDRESEDDGESAIVETTRRQALGRRWRHLSEERLRGKSARLPRGKRFLDLSADERAAFEALLGTPGFRDRVLGLGPDGGGELSLIDAAYWIKGCSSLGKMRLAGLVRVAGAKDRSKVALIDVKEAVPYLAPAAEGALLPDDLAQRVVEGARALSPALGERMIAGRIGETPVIVRELLPQDLKIVAEQFSKDEGVRVARSLAAVVGRAHGRQLSPEDLRRWRACVEADGWHERAPHWLWSSVTDLMGLHQSGYLAHCRDVARDKSLAAYL
ncbi:DUF2252 family protein [Methylobacterium aerolatum]|uniref:Uncharacterized protein (DUF2252 family) n=1 Tax=Methylobacterium aerolatum TaxID=418708 RepID=A0ABU0HZZ8_9HYPH|nr:DUF2252 family protein [Methylobacterium aerolatum]MDQ0447917.1 uncharacterized protein (DUF2252 family) [Methylobacterium aerolatum]GJD34376.1 hypothetical protein FMGBMHLM_1274 [Methylobacterium aerolatum]